ncbi:MAG: signal peptidase II [Parachlamydiales bacterium]|jgi:signal peptidase II
MPKTKSRLQWLFFFLVLLGLDLFLKHYVYHCLPKMNFLHPVYPYGGIGVFQDILGFSLSLVHVANQGAAWGFLANFPNFLWYLRLFIICFLAVYLLFRPLPKAKFLALALILVGAIGNLTDRLLYEAVIDMFYFQFGAYSYPVFNLADSYITIGITVFLLASLKEEKKHAA